MAALRPFEDRSLPARERAADLVAHLEREEKFGLMSSRQEAVPRLGLGEFYIGGEAAHGLQSPEGPATMFPQTIGLASTWDEALLEEAGALIGDQARAYYSRRGGVGGLCLWAPTVDMERDPRWGRTEEAYGEDPLLTGRLSAAYVRGMQGPDPAKLKAVPTPKHFYGNNNEEGRCSRSASIDPRSRREYYLKAFEPTLSARGARAASFMTSYNAIDGVPAIFNPEIESIVRGEWGFEGFVVCDASSLSMAVSHHGYCDDLAQAIALAVKAGVDNFTESAALVRKALGEALERGLLSWDDIDRAIARTLAVRIRLGQLDPPEGGPDAAPNVSALWSRRGRDLARRAAREAIVLLRNGGDRPILPLDPGSAGRVALIGPLADACYRDWYSGTPQYRTSPLAALCARLGEEKVLFEDGCDLVSLRAEDGRYVGLRSWVDAELAADIPAACGGEVFRMSDWGWGNQTFRSLTNGRFLSAAQDGLVEASAAEVWGWYVRERFSLGPAVGIDGAAPGAPRAAAADAAGSDAAGSGAAADAAGSDAAADAPPKGPSVIRTWDGKAVGLDAERRLVAGAAKAESFTVELHRDGIATAARAAATVDTAIVFVGNHPLLVAKEEIDREEIGLAPAQERLVEAVAAANPRTVVVVVGSYPFALGPWKDRVAAILHTAHGGQEAGNAIADVFFGDCNPAGRLPMTWYRSLGQIGGIMDYDIARGKRTYRYFEGEPLYPFGYGLSYSRFAYSWAQGGAGARSDGHGGFIADFSIENLSSRDGDEVPQLYIACKGSAVYRPIRQLADFRRIAIPAGGSVRLSLRVSPGDFDYWDAAASSWIREEAAWELQIGSSSADIRLSSKVQVEGGSEASSKAGPRLV